LAAINETLVQLVLKEMLNYKPSLQKVLSTGEEEELSDPRYVGQLVIRNFPSLIGVELRRLFSVSLRQPDKLRLEQIFFSIERCLQFICFTMVSQLWNEVKHNRINIAGNFRNEFGKMIINLSIDNYIRIIRSIRILFAENSITWFIPDIMDNLDNAFFESVDLKAPPIDDSGHYKFDVSATEIEGNF